MTAARRWVLVGLGIVVLVTTPAALRALPVPDTDVRAATLLARVVDSARVPFSGYAESTGGLQLPVTDRFSGLAKLLGDRTRMRVWWRSPNDWRVDAIDLTGETDLVRDSGGLTVWQYEAARVTYTVDAVVRLPRSADLVPAVLGRTLLSGARPDEVTRLPAKRVAGRGAPGVRLTPTARQSSIDHVDVWVDPATGLALRVDVYGNGDTTAAMTTSFLTFTPDRPAASSTAFSPPPGADIHSDSVVDIAAAANRFAAVRPPRRLAGLRRRSTADLGAVGEYGRGATLLLAIPLWDDVADPLRQQLETTPGARIGRNGTEVTVGPLAMLLTERRFAQPSWLLTGSVTRRTLTKAAAQLPARASLLP